MWFNMPFQGIGVGVSLNHFGGLKLVDDLLQEPDDSCSRRKPMPDYIEIYVGNGVLQQRAMDLLDECRKRGVAISFHTAFLDLWNYIDPDDRALGYTLDQIRLLDPAWCNQDLMLTKLGGLREGVLFTGLMTAEAASGFAIRHKAIQSRFPVPLLLENPPYRLIAGDLSFGDFFRKLAEEADCGLTLDIGHVLAASILLEKPMLRLLEAYPFERVCEIHVAGGYVDDRTRRYVDNHDASITDEVLQLLADVIPCCANLKAVTYELQNPNLVEARDRFDSLQLLIASCDQRFGAN